MLTNTTELTGINTKGALTTFYNTVSEAGFEAYEANKSLRDEYARTFGYFNYEAVPEKEKALIAEKAGEGAARVFA